MVTQDKEQNTSTLTTKVESCHGGKSKKRTPKRLSEVTAEVLETSAESKMAAAQSCFSVLIVSFSSYLPGIFHEIPTLDILQYSEICTDYSGIFHFASVLPRQPFKNRDLLQTADRDLCVLHYCVRRRNVIAMNWLKITSLSLKCQTF